MYGKWVVLNLGESIECKVWVNCTPQTSEIELIERALNILRSKTNESRSYVG